MGHSGTGARAPVDFHSFFGHSRTNSESLSLDSIRGCLPVYPDKKYTGLLSLFIAQMDVSIKLFSLSFVPLLTRNPGDGTGRMHR